MKDILTAFTCEILKLKRSPVFWSTFAFFIFIPMVLGVLLIIVQHPEIMEKMGVVATKAELVETNDWNGFLSLMDQMVAMLGMIGFGFVTSWVFGREYMEQTVTDLLAVPISRTKIVIAKYIMTIIWSLLLFLVLLISGLIIGWLVHIPDASKEVFSVHMKIYGMAGGLVILLNMPVAYIASRTRGIIAPLAFTILMLILAQFAVVLGLGSYFPWAMPGLLTVPNGGPGMELVPFSYIIFGMVVLMSFFGTIVWWQRADQK